MTVRAAHAAPRPAGRLASPVVVAGAFTVAGLAFWVLRVRYWSAVEEAPFSDMANFDAVAHGITSSWNFEWNPFWRTYTTPTLVLARALQIFLLGDSLWGWRLFQGGLACAALGWLAWELKIATRNVWLSVALAASVAFSQPSIFWSLKLAREGFHELLTFCTAAAVLFALRHREKAWAFVLAGAVVAATFLNRPNAVLLAPCCIVLVLAWRYRAVKGGEVSKLGRLKRGLPQAGLVLLGIFVIWTPWIVRSTRIYGEPVLLNTQGPYGVLWELGRFHVRLDDGTVVETTVDELQAEAPKRFANDLEASRYAQRLANAWLREHRAELPGLIAARVTRTVNDRSEYLTHVPRDRLFGSGWDSVLIDKHAVLIWGGVLGLFALGLLYDRRLFVLPIVALVPWLTAALVLGYPRMLEPAIALIQFGNVAWLVALSRVVARLRRR